MGITSDYFVRGISRSNDQAALQLDLHYVSDWGLLAGVFASNTQIDPGERKDAEISGYLGYVWATGADWQSKVLVTAYTYPWDFAGSRYNYEEIELGTTFRSWLNLTVSYSPNAPRYIYSKGLSGVSAESAELNIQRPLWQKLSGSAGVGYYHLSDGTPSGYTYWSVGVVYDLSPVSLAVSYVDTSAAANLLFYNAASGGRWAGTILWRF